MASAPLISSVPIAKVLDENLAPSSPNILLRCLSSSVLTLLMGLASYLINLHH